MRTGAADGPRGATGASPTVAPAGRRIASGPVGTRAISRARPLGALVIVSVMAGALRLVSGVGFANYDSLYALVWGQQLSRGQVPQYAIALAPTPHPLVEALGLILSPLGPHTTEQVAVALGYLSLSACGWVIFRLGECWFGRATGALGALLLLTRVPILSYGARAYVDVPYMLFVLSALLVEARRPKAGAPVLVLLGLAGLLRPEAWAFSGLYWLYLAHRPRADGRRRELVRLAAIGAVAPALWMASDALITGDPLWSLLNTRHTAHTLVRITGIANVPVYIPRRIGEILRPAVLVGAALGGVLSLSWLRARALPGALAGVLALAVFAAFATLGLPINTRYAFLASAMLCVFCGAGACAWRRLPLGDRRRRGWAIASILLGLALLAQVPGQYRSADRELDNLAAQQVIQDDLVALVGSHALSPRCGPVGVPNHRPVPLLALRLRTSPNGVISAQVSQLTRGTYVAPANAAVTARYTLDPHDPRRLTAAVPPGFRLVSSNRSWDVYQRCA